MITTQVLIVDDQDVVRASLRELVEADEGILVVGEAANGEEALAMAQNLTPTVMLVDLRMPRRDGLWLIRAIREDSVLSDTRILVLTTFESDHNVVSALQLGANGFLGKTAPPQMLVDAIRALAAGNSWLSTGAATSVVQYLNAVSGCPGTAQQPPGLEDLTSREREIALLVAGGLSNEDIAAQLVISRYTVKTHVNRAMMKLGVNDRGGLVALIHKSGLMGSRPD